MAWLILCISGLFECGWAIGLKQVDGLSKPLPLLFVAACMGVSLGGLAIALRSLPVGTAYAVWTGVGAAGTATLGIWLYGEAATPLRLVSLGLIIAGIVGLRLA